MFVGQRCREPVRKSRAVKFRLGLVQAEAAIAALPESCEPLLVTGEPASVTEIVSDEVLLALPLVALHGQGSTCHEFIKDYQPPKDAKRENPFAVLAELKQKQT